MRGVWEVNVYQEEGQVLVFESQVLKSLNISDIRKYKCFSATYCKPTVSLKLYAFDY